jgi:hypothetical protein
MEKMKQKFENDSEEIMELRDDVLLQKANLNTKVLGVLLKKFIDTADELIDARESDNRVNEMGESLKNVLGEIKEIIKSFKPQELKPQINFDTKPIALLAETIRTQNKEIIELLRKPQDDKISRELMQMITRNNEFIGRATQQHDYSKQLQAIADNLNKKEEIKWPSLKVKRNFGGVIDELIPVINK